MVNNGAPTMATEDKPMKIRLKLVPSDSMNELTCDIFIHGEDDFDDVVCTALTKLLRSTWSLAPGDTIKIVEV
jgi:hypothetical protein